MNLSKYDFFSNSMNDYKLLDIEYFNLEISSCGTAFVLNGNKKGIDLFLKKYGHLSIPPKEISFQEWLRPQRIWHSRYVVENNRALPTDPSPYQATSNLGDVDDNLLCQTLQIKFLDNDDNIPILSVGCKIDKLIPQLFPRLAVNKKGWEKFLSIVRHLRDKCYWFYVTRINNEKWSHLPFQLSPDYYGDSEDFVCNAIECIRLEEEERFFFDMEEQSNGAIYLGGNSGGLLLFSQWLRGFALNREESKDIINKFNDMFKSVRYGETMPEGREYLPPNNIHLRKVNENKSSISLAFGRKKNNINDCYVFANSKGFEVLADVIEMAAFRFDYDFFVGNQPPDTPNTVDCPGNKVFISGDVIVSDEFILAKSWWLYEGGRFNPAYGLIAKWNFTSEERSQGEIGTNFINERICYGNS